uniref:CAP-Gly domain-containing protein n=1 Tax=Scylla olivacea TaxID=85551 RepID=A0A0P4WGS4_SCYOL
MNQEWTYRPPVLVGERIVWLGGDTTPEPGEPCNYHPHHGTVSWIGRVSEIGNDWIVGVEFELDMAGGCDGTWKGRKLFSCPKMRGLFLPVASVIKEKEFYSKKDCLPSNTTSVTAPVSSNTSQSQTNIDLSLAPEPPPPKNKMPLHSPSIIHSRNAKKVRKSCVDWLVSICC